MVAQYKKVFINNPSYSTNHHNHFHNLVSSYLKLWPVHSHINSMIARPPAQIFATVCAADGAVEVCVYLGKPESKAWSIEYSTSDVQ